MKFTLRQLEIFLAISKFKNISRAADSLYMSQSAASAALHNFESCYEASLFDRSGKKLELSETGHMLRTEAESLLTHARKFEHLLEGHGEIGHLKVGASYTIGNHLAVGYLAGYLNEHPDANVEFDVANTPEVVSKVLNFEVDVGMIEGEVQHRALQLIPWREDKLVVFCCPDHPLAKKKNLTDKEIKETRWILREPDSGARHTFNAALAGLMPEINIYLEFKHNEAIKKAVEAGLGIGCLSEIVLERNFKNGDLVPLELLDRDMTRTLYFVLPRKRYQNKAVDWWMQQCMSMDGKLKPVT